MPRRFSCRPARQGAALLLVGWALSACAPAPETRDAQYPVLLPLSGLLTEADAEAAAGTRAQAAAVDTSARLALLEARAAALRGPVLAPQDRQRLEALLARAPG
ncbi:hypothetical protein [Alkalilacustris brevis]|uniref:hypothetical protein n=1 Tax=Alkalilacustris brevis TaxID=2026338 RepID=UPI000E0DE811|nr:hypothetical protein [Alkalilacustris brevis]